MHLTRRGFCVAAPLALAPQAVAAWRDHPGARAWSPRPPNSPPAPLGAMVETAYGERTLRAWIGPRPCVLALWASWCGPCLVEKPGQAAMAQRLEKAGARARILPLQAFDNISRAAGRDVLDRLGAHILPATRASAAAEQRFIAMFGRSPREPDRVSMPSLLLLDELGVELGRTQGAMVGVDGEVGYWEDEATFAFLANL
jgi:thiol-disulfide isomerase/thioredoxin